MVNRQLKYNRARMAVMELIVSHGLSIGDMIPAQRSLAEQLPFSEVTIRHALSDMEESGLIVRRRGSGTYVAKAFNQVDHQENILFINVYRDLAQEGSPSVDPLRCYLEARGVGLKSLFIREFSSAVVHAAENALGIILYGWLTDSFIRNVQALGLPLVVMGNSRVGLDVPVVSLDIEQTAYQMTQMMMNHGLRRIALFRFQDDYYPSIQAEKGYLRALSEKGAAAMEIIAYPWVEGKPLRYEQAIAEFMAQHRDVEGILLEHAELVDLMSWYWHHEYPRKLALGFLSHPADNREFQQSVNYMFPKFGNVSLVAGKMLLCYLIRGEPMTSVRLAPEFAQFDDV